MKRILTFLTLLLVVQLSLFSQNTIPTAFDECVDLVSLVWRLTGAKEYNNCPITPYNQQIEEFFGPYKDHSTIQLARKYRQESGVAYDAIASLATHLKITADGQVVMNDALENHIDSRWTESMQNEFLTSLNDFYTETSFHQWYTSTLPLQQTCLQAFQKLSSMIDQSWYDAFFLKSDVNFRIILCPLAGVNNYGTDCFLKDGGHQICPVISSTSYKDGQITYENSAFPIIIHEFCHAYCNPLIDAYWGQMEKSAESIYALNSKVLSEQAYTTAKIMMYESLVRASVICYMQDHFTPLQVNFEELISDEENKGFILTRTLMNSLRQYENDKTHFPTLDAYMTELLKVINGFTVKKYKALQKEADKNKIHYKVNIKNGSTQVPSGDFTLVITFDEPLYKPGISMNVIDADFPEFKGYSWSEDCKVLSVNIHMEHDHEYGFQINGSSYRNKDGKVAVESVYKFKTRK